MSHVVKDFTNLIGSPFSEVDLVLRKAGAQSMVGAQNNGSWLIPGSLSQYGNVPNGQVGVTYLLGGRDAWISLTYSTATGKVTRCVQFAAAKNWVQRTGSAAELVVSAIASYWTAGLSAAVTHKLDQKEAGALTSTSKNTAIGVLDTVGTFYPTGSQIGISMGSSTSSPARPTVASPAPAPTRSVSSPAPMPSNGGGMSGTMNNQTMLIIGVGLIAVAVVMK